MNRTGAQQAVDDGEPSGTAGRPMLDVLRHQDLEGVRCALPYALEGLARRKVQAAGGALGDVQHSPHSTKRTNPLQSTAQ